MDRVSNRLSRSSSVIYESSHLPDETYNVSTSAWLPPDREFQKRRFDPFFNFTKKSAYVDHRRERWRDPSAVGVVSPRGQEIHPKAVDLFSEVIPHIS
jgi:hypothetical protein